MAGSRAPARSRPAGAGRPTARSGGAPSGRPARRAPAPARPAQAARALPSRYKSTAPPRRAAAWRRSGTAAVSAASSTRLLGRISRLLHGAHAGPFLQVPNRLVRSGDDRLADLQPVRDLEVFVPGDPHFHLVEVRDPVLHHEHALGLLLRAAGGRGLRRLGPGAPRPTPGRSRVLPTGQPAAGNRRRLLA